MFYKGKSDDSNGKESVNTPSDDSNSGGSGESQARFGTLGGVFTPCVLTILGVIMFMRTGFVVGHAGLWLGLAILGISKLITTLTTLSLSAIATNLEMRVGGVYFMISRVLGPDFGGSIGITLFIAQAVSVAFYTIGFTEALFSLLNPLLASIHLFGMDGSTLVATIHLPQILSSIVVLGLFFLTFKGADVAIKAQYVVLGILLLAVASFLVGGALQFDAQVFASNKRSAFSGGVGFWTAFAIFFPAATGITAGANMSGDLKNPGKSIPWGTLIAILFTAAVYVAQLFLTAGATPRADLKSGAFEALQNMSVFGPLIILGVFAATLSSALGSFLGAPRILQAMGQDRLMRVMTFFGKGSGETNEPKRATVLTFIIAICVIWAGDLNAVAEVISMFFLIAYGMINLSAFVESKSANPSFRPSFKFFHWSTGLAGAIGCTIAMVKINETYALMAVAIVAVIYFYLRKRDIKTSFGDAKRGYIFQRTRDNLLYLEQAKAHPKNWRPVLVAVTEEPLKQAQLVRVGSWLESRRGLYTVAQIAERKGASLPDKVQLRNAGRTELKKQLDVDGIVAFSEYVSVDEYFEGLATFIQSYSIGGLRPNTVLVSMPPAGAEAARDRFLQTMEILASFDLNLAVLKPGDMALTKRRRTIDLWWRGEKNGSLMALFAYLMKLDRTWSNAQLRVLRIVKDDHEEKEARIHLNELKEHTRIAARIEVIRSTDPPPDIIAERSGPVADLVLLGMAAASGDEVHRFLDQIDPLLQRLPTTVLIWSNGDADVFA
ncbi:MAG: amino acid permease [Deltaproteobacteria bacterium]|nr:amino acid permease [Deltaproteobacteria bacterium]